jgi:hypothetical protein
MKKTIPPLVIAIIAMSCYTGTHVPREKHRIKEKIGYVQAIHDPGKGADTTHFFYNPDEHIAHVTFSHGSKYDYEYLNGKIVKKYYDGQRGLSYVDTYILNKTGLVERMIPDQSLPSGIGQTREYNAENYVVKIIFNDTMYSSFQYNNGNEILNTHIENNEPSNSTTNFIYDKDRLNTIANDNMGSDFLGADSKNPVKTYTLNFIGMGPGTYNCNYQYDAQGRIIVKAVYANGSGRLIDSTAYTYY